MSSKRMSSRGRGGGGRGRKPGRQPPPKKQSQLGQEKKDASKKEKKMSFAAAAKQVIEKDAAKKKEKNVTFLVKQGPSPSVTMVIEKGPRVTFRPLVTPIERVDVRVGETVKVVPPKKPQGPKLPERLNVVRDAALLAKIQDLLPTVRVVRWRDERREMEEAVNGGGTPLTAAKAKEKDAPELGGNQAVEEAVPSMPPPEEEQPVLEVAATPPPPRSESPVAPTVEAEPEAEKPESSPIPPPHTQPLPLPLPPCFRFLEGLRELDWSSRAKEASRMEEESQRDLSFFLHMGRYRPEDSCFYEPPPPPPPAAPAPPSTSPGQEKGEKVKTAAAHHPHNTRSKSGKSGERGGTRSEGGGGRRRQRGGGGGGGDVIPNRKTFNCSFCLCPFHDEEGLIKHLVSMTCRPAQVKKSAHSPKCPFCLRPFSRKIELEKHIHQHEDMFIVKENLM